MECESITEGLSQASFSSDNSWGRKFKEVWERAWKKYDVWPKDSIYIWLLDDDDDDDDYYASDANDDDDYYANDANHDDDDDDDDECYASFPLLTICIQIECWSAVSGRPPHWAALNCIF